MTHGVLEIICGGKRRFLHTYHTGMIIPRVVLRDSLTCLRWNKVPFVRRDHRTAGMTRDEAVEWFRDGVECETLSAWTEDIDYVQSLMVSARPCFLIPANAAYRKSLPTWSGMDRTHKLRISPRGLWTFTEDCDELTTTAFYPLDKIAEMIADEHQPEDLKGTPPPNPLDASRWTEKRFEVDKFTDDVWEWIDANKPKSKKETG